MVCGVIYIVADLWTKCDSMDKLVEMPGEEKKKKETSFNDNLKCLQYTPAFACLFLCFFHLLLMCAVIPVCLELSDSAVVDQILLQNKNLLDAIF